MKTKTLKQIIMAVFAAAALAAAGWWFFRSCVSPMKNGGRKTSFSAVTLSRLSPTRQLRVMSIYKEVVVGRTKTENTLLGPMERKIYAIYPAQLNIGYDLSEFGDDWIRASHDTVYVSLPPVKVLNEGGQFVDEARRRVPIESGTWTAGEMNELRTRANQEMLLQCAEDGCFSEATAQGRALIESLLHSLGYRNVVIDGVTVQAPRTNTPGR